MSTSSSLAFGPFELNGTTFRLLRDGVTVPLEPKAIDVLRLLLERAPGVVEKGEIFAVVWKDVAVTDNALTRVVAQLRKALDDDAKHPRYIETVATRGYRMVAEVRVVPGTPGPALSGLPERTPDAPLAVSGRHQPRRFRPVSWAGFVGIVVGALLLAAVLRPLWSNATADGSAPASASRSPQLELALARPVQLTTGPGYDGMPAYSPDGTSLAFASDRSGAFEIYVQQLVAGAAPARLTTNGRQNVQPAWSPDGRFIAFHEAAGGGIWIVPSRGGTARRLVETGSRPAWSPDGSLIAYQDVDAAELTMLPSPTLVSGLRVVDPQTGDSRLLTRSGTPAGPHMSPQWSPDGRHLYFVETPVPYANDHEEARSSIWRIAVDGTGLLRVAGGTLLTSEYVPARDERGAWTVMRTSTIWWQPFNAATPDLAGSPTGLTMPGLPAQLALSTSGRMLAWTARSSVTNLWTVPLSNGVGRPGAAAPVPIGSGVRVTGAAAAPDGRLAYSGTVRGNSSQIWIRDEEGGMRQVTTDAGDHFIPFWLPDHQEVAFFAVHQGVDSYRAVNVSTGRERQLFRVADLPLPASTTVHPLPSLNVVPDAAVRRVVVTLLKDGVPNLWVFRLSDGGFDAEATQLTAEAGGGSFPHWSPDGRSISYQCGEGAHTHVCVVAADGADRRQLTHEPGQSFLGGWMGDRTILVAARRAAVWNVIGVDAHSGAVMPITSFSDARGYVRYPQWDEASRRILFERAETTGNVWSVELAGRD